MVIAGEYREIKHDSIEGLGNFNCGEWYEILTCQNCEKVELRVHSYHHGLSEEEMPTVYKTLYPSSHSIPDGLPKRVRQEYELALKARHGDSNAYGVLLGRVLEAVFHDKKAKGYMLGQQLKDLAERNALPPEIITFAEKLNKLRAFGAHFNAGKLTAKDVPIMEKLAKVILESVYSAPHIIRQAEKAINKVDNKKTKVSRNVNIKNTTKVSAPFRRMLVNEVPLGDFEEISIRMPDWESTFLELIEHRKLIKYNVYQMPNLNYDIKTALSKNGYRDLILSNDHDKHYLVPKNR